MARFPGAAVLLILLVAVSMYGGTSLGRALERKPDSVSISIRGLIEYFTKTEAPRTHVLRWQTLELSGAKEGGRDADEAKELSGAKEGGRDGDEAKVDRGAEDTRFAMASPRPGGRSMQPGTAYRGVEVARPRPRPRRSSNFSGEITDAWPRGVVKVGPWGGSGGQPFYMRGSSVPRLRSITLYHSSSAIHSLSCAYYSKDEDGDVMKRMAGPWGLPHSFGSTALRATIYLSADEHLTAIEGTSGHFGRLPDLVITSLSFRTNTGKTYGPYGEKRGTRTTYFSVPAENGCIVGFWGRSGWLLDAIGVYIRVCTPTPPVYRQLY